MKSEEQKKFIEDHVRESCLMTYAQNELDLLDIERASIYGSYMRDAVLEVLRVIDRQGHSGGSISEFMLLLERLVAFKPLTPLRLDDAEFGESYDKNGTRQNKRLSSVFMDARGGSYYIDAFTCQVVATACYGAGSVQPNRKGICWHSHPFVVPVGSDKPVGRLSRCYLRDGIQNFDTVRLPTLEVERERDDWDFYVLAGSPEFKELERRYSLEIRPVENTSDVSEYIRTFRRDMGCELSR